MGTEKICSACGKPLPASAPEGLCPECLMKAGFATGTAPEAGAPPQPASFVLPSVADLAKLFPQFELLELLGQGGMGAVYKARQPGLDRLVALKILPPGVAREPGFAERFTREARALARLSHPNVVAVHDFGQAGEFHYLVMEFVDGANLRQIERAGKLGPREALKIIPQICEALQFAHDEGIVHRDIKPENILVDKRGRVKIADFGIAKMLGRTGEATLTGARDVVGTPHYMAPEQVEKPQAVDHRADIYSLGVVFYEMLTGELPLGKFQPPSRKVEVDVRLDEVVLHALEKEPERRYQQASEVRTDVQRIAATPATGTPEPSADLENVRRQVRGPAIGLVVAGILNWILMPVLAVVILWIAPAEWQGGPLNLSNTGVKLACVGSLFLCSLVIYAALQMLRLEGYWTAIAAAILAMLVAPGNLAGLPLGIWALAILTRPEVRAGFVKSRRDRWMAVGACLALGILGVQLILLGSGLVHRAERTPVRAESPLFGAVTERVLNDLDEHRGDEALNLYTGQLLSLPADFGELTPSAHEAWLRTNGVDLLADFARNRWGLMSRGVRFRDLANEQWARPDLRNWDGAWPDSRVLERHEVFEGVIYLLPANPQFPMTFAFATASGAEGVMQISGSHDAPHGIRIRYKLLISRSGGGRAASTGAARW